MSNKIDVEIYIKNVINFFENNPNDLMILIGESNKDRFYEEIKNVVYRNFEENKDIELSRNQLINIVLDITKNNKIDKTFLMTKLGEICLN